MAEQPLSIAQLLTTAVTNEPTSPTRTAELAQKIAAVTSTFHPDTPLAALHASAYSSTNDTYNRRDWVEIILNDKRTNLSEQGRLEAREDCSKWRDFIYALRSEDRKAGDTYARRTGEVSRSLSAISRKSGIKTVRDLQEIAAKIQAQGKLDESDAQIGDLLAKSQMSPARLLFLAAAFLPPQE